MQGSTKRRALHVKESVVHDLHVMHPEQMIAEKENPLLELAITVCYQDQVKNMCNSPKWENSIAKIFDSHVK